MRLQLNDSEIRKFFVKIVIVKLMENSTYYVNYKVARMQRKLKKNFINLSLSDIRFICAREMTEI